MIEQYLINHAIDINVFTAYGLSSDEWRITIPVYNKDGRFLFNKYRMLKNPDRKYSYDKGASVSLFGIDKVKEKEELLFITEGEMDALSLVSLGIKAISTTGGAGSWRTEFSEILNELKVQKVVLCYDRDDAGIFGMFRVFRHLCSTYNGIVSIALIPAFFVYGNKGKDVGEFLSMGHSLSEIIELELPPIYDETHTKTKRISQIKKAIKVLNDFEISEEYRTHDRVYIDSIRSAMLTEYKNMKKQYNKVLIDSTGIEKVKDIPITNFIIFNNKKAKCIFHDDHNPSMFYNDFNHKDYPNTVKCFSCGKFGSVIDIIMAQQNLDFGNAIRWLKRMYGIQ